MKQQNIQIVVLGAGYAGMMAALRLSGKTRKLGAEVVLVNGVDTFVQRPRLHQAATGQPVLQTPISEMLRGTRVQFLQGWVSAIHPATRCVTIKTAQRVEELGYDYLVYALGSAVDQDTVPGLREHAYVLDPRGSNASGAVLERLRAISQSGGQVVVVGGGATGIEGATEIKGWFPNMHVSLVTDSKFGAFKGTRIERHFREAFRKQDISIHEGCRVRAVEAGHVLADGERNTSGEKIPFDVCVWAGGFHALPLAREAGFNVNERGQILVDPFGRSLSHPEVYAVGDASHPVEEPGVPLRMSLQTALTRGAHAADNITAHIRGKAQTPLSFAYYGQGIALGPDDAVGFLTYPADELIGPVMRGKAAVNMRNFFVWMIFYFLKLEQWMPGFFFWIGKGRYAQAKRAGQITRASNISETRYG